MFKVEGKKDLYIACADRWHPEMMDLEYKKYARLLKNAFDLDLESDQTIKELVEYIGNDSQRNTSIANYVWLPIRFDGEVPYLEWRDEWRLDEFE